MDGLQVTAGVQLQAQGSGGLLALPTAQESPCPMPSGVPRSVIELDPSGAGWTPQQLQMPCSESRPLAGLCPRLFPGLTPYPNVCFPPLGRASQRPPPESAAAAAAASRMTKLPLKTLHSACLMLCSTLKSAPCLTRHLCRTPRLYQAHGWVWGCRTKRSPAGPRGPGRAKLPQALVPRAF